MEQFPIPQQLMTAGQAEQEFGSKYFYRQRIYRLAEAGKIESFDFSGLVLFSVSDIVAVVLKELELRIATRYPILDVSNMRVFYEVLKGKTIVVDGIYGKGITIDTDKYNEESLLNKIGELIEEGKQEQFMLEIENLDIEEETDKTETSSSLTNQAANPLSATLPEEILWIRVTTNEIEGVEIKSGILISLPSIAQFIGTRTDKFAGWVSSKTFAVSVLSGHNKQIHGTLNQVAWKRGITSGLTSFVPFELLPEIIVAYRQSGISIKYKEKAQMLYELASATLEAVGLAISGDKQRAADELTRIGRFLGINAADEIITIFKLYESRDFQIKTTKEFHSKVKSIKEDYKTITGKLTLGITSRTASEWKAFGASRKLPKSILDSSREVMRALSPGDSVGMTFGEKHYIEEPEIDEAIITGQQGKDFYARLTRIGLLKDIKKQEQLTEDKVKKTRVKKSP